MLLEKEPVDLEVHQDEIIALWNDIIVLWVDINEIDIDTANRIYCTIQDKLPNHKVLMLPKEITINTFTKEQIQEIANNLNNFLAELD